MSIHDYYIQLNSQSGIKAYIKKKIFGNLLKELINQEKILNEQKNKLDVLSDKLDVLSEHIGNWIDIPDVLVDDGIIPKKSYLEEYGEKCKIHSKDTFFLNLSNVFRGSECDIGKTVGMFLPYVLNAARYNPTLPFIDFGCGRGEFLDALRDNNIMSIGIDMNRESAARAIEKGHNVIVGDAISFLKNRGESSISGLSMIMVSEHISFPELFDSMFLFWEKIAEGGPLLINTINPYCYERYGHFHLDPSHINFLPPEIYKLIMEMAGFQDIKVLWSAPIRNCSSHDIHAQYENVSLIGYTKNKHFQDNKIQYCSADF